MLYVAENASCDRMLFTRQKQSADHPRRAPSPWLPLGGSLELPGSHERPNAITATIAERKRTYPESFAMPTRLHTVAVLVTGFVAASFASPRAALAKDADNSAKAPVKRIVLFNSGVGYFEHQGQVDGNASIDLKFDVDDVNDLLKSMVLEDRDGGTISTVTYGSRDPITKTLQTFAIDLTSNPTLGQLLAQIRGERIEIDAPNKIEGSIVGVETQTQMIDERRTVELEQLTLLTDEGLRRIPLDSIGRIKLADRELDAEFRQALKILASAHAADKKSVTLNFRGEGQRNVRIGYIQEAPVWKTSYRLVLDEKEKPFLQGWAIVENTTDADWDDVKLSLVSGRPISFQMDLYSPLYAQRPVVTPELYSSLRPQVYDQSLMPAMRGVQRFGLAEARSSNREKSGPRGMGGAMGGGMGGGLVGDASAAPTAASAAADEAGFSGESFRSSVAPAAQAADVGELFKYDIADAVTLARQSSAMLPIINDSVEGRKVSIYNAAVHAKHPLNGLELKNTSELHLMQGPITVFDDGVYAGDAQLADLPPGEKRLLSYALDLDVEVAPATDVKPQRLATAKLEKGVLLSTLKQARVSKYTLKNASETARTVLVEHPIEGRWTLAKPEKPSEKTRDRYRFAVDVPAGESHEFAIEEQSIERQRVAFADPFNDAALNQFSAIYLESDAVSDQVKDAIRELIRRGGEIAELTRQKDRLTAQLKSIVEQQDRIRNNMQSIDRASELYKRYVKKFTDQEDEFEKLTGEVQELDAKIAAARKDLDAYLADLTLE
jgi:hypothetical protein